MQQKTGRNDPCPCGSGKKFKKCCEMKAKTKRFHAEVIPSPDERSSAETSKIASLFFKRSITPLTPPSSNVTEETSHPNA